ncbi:hypothetical protein [Caballeronia calidae]|uniref:hypothetical protein n=1 Tax=Caballeronia calidae TaxID=1777139 RepID=UPI0012FD20A9|nr:hypothetical protein [Caballeronia calidae]
MKNNAKQIEIAEGQRAAIRSTDTDLPSQPRLDLMHERRLRLIEVRGVRASYRL